MPYPCIRSKGGLLLLNMSWILFVHEIHLYCVFFPGIKAVINSTSWSVSETVCHWTEVWLCRSSGGDRCPAISWLRMRQMLMEIFQQYLYAVPCCHHLLRTCYARCVGSIHSPPQLLTAPHPRHGVWPRDFLHQLRQGHQCNSVIRLYRWDSGDECPICRGEISCVGNDGNWCRVLWTCVKFILQCQWLLTLPFDRLYIQ